jgi:hypothetical protein
MLLPSKQQFYVIDNQIRGPGEIDWALVIVYQKMVTS